MSTLTVILNRDLEPTELKLRTRTVKGAYVSTKDDLLDYTKTDNHLINAFLLAYNNHRRLSLCPDDLLMALNLAVSNCINTFPDDFRKTFVDHEGKKKLVVKKNCQPGYRDWDDLIAQMDALLAKSLKVEYPLFPEFTTTTQAALTASRLTTMSAFKEYFAYGFMLCCGIPSVELRGTKQDWETLQTKYQQLRALFSKNAHDHMDLWFTNLDRIIELFVNMRNLALSGEVEGTNDMKELWSRVVTYVPYGSGGQKYLSGWSQWLAPNFSKNVRRQQPFVSNLLNLESSPPEKGNNYYGWQDQMKAWAQITRDDSAVPGSICECPAELNDYGRVSKITFRSGFIGVIERKEAIVPVLGWWATEQAMREPVVTREVEADVTANDPHGLTAAVATARKGDATIYVSDNGDDDLNDGLSRELPVKSLDRASELMEQYTADGYNIKGIEML